MTQIIAILAQLVTEPTSPETAEYYAEQTCKAFPDDLCSDWHVAQAAPCDDDGETTCVIATHPTAWGNAPSVWMLVFDHGDNLAIGAVWQGDRFVRVLEGN